MKTEFIDFSQKELIKKVLYKNEAIAFPTETVYGLGCLSNSEIAFNNLVKVKNRVPNKPFTMMISNVDMIKNYCELNELCLKIVKKFMPGSITLLVKRKNNIPHYLYLESDYIGFRIPKNKDLIDLIEFIGEPLLVPSANKSNEKPCLKAQEVYDVFKNEISLIIKKDDDLIDDVPSTILQIDGNDIKLIREGKLKLEEIKKELNLL